MSRSVGMAPTTRHTTSRRTRTQARIRAAMPLRAFLNLSSGGIRTPSNLGRLHAASGNARPSPMILQTGPRPSVFHRPHGSPCSLTYIETSSVAVGYTRGRPEELRRSARVQCSGRGVRARGPETDRGGIVLNSSRNTIIAVACFVVLGLVVVGGSIYYFAKSTAEVPDDTGAGASAAADEESLSGADSGPAIVATFDGEPIERGEYEAAWEEFLARGGADESDVPVVTYLGARYDALMQLVSDRIIQDGLEQFDIEVTQEDKLAAARTLAADRIVRRHATEEALQFELQSRGVTFEEYVNQEAAAILEQGEEEITEQVKAVKLGRKVAEDVSIDPEELPDYLRLVDIQRITQLFEPVQPGAAVVPEDEAEETIREAYRKLQEGESFESLVQEYSNGAEAENGGRLEGLRYGLEPTFDEVAWAMEPGQVSEPFKTETGWHVIKILQFREQPMPEDEQAREELRMGLEAAIAEEMTTEWMVDQLERGELQIEDPALAGIDAMREGRFEEAKQHLETALAARTGVDQLPVMSSLGQAVFETGDYERTEEIHREMLDLALPRHEYVLYVDWAAFKLAIDEREEGLEKLRLASEVAETPDQRIELAQYFASVEARELALEELRMVRENIPEPTEDMPPQERGAAYTQMITLALIHGRLGFEEQGKEQLRALIQDSYDDQLIYAVAQAGAEMGWQDIIDAAQARVDQMVSEAGAMRNMIEEQPPSQGGDGGE
ncbi:MAG: hypothetical protein GF320_12325 [Armatimonadia bacterium]|nr:hypothetical protein [Armatimonadia bacterium]